jgi:diguanylate cyclase (GGDEF)-like protein
MEKMSYADEVISLEDLQELFLFRHVSAESVEGVLDQCRIMTLAKDEILLTPGEKNHRIFHLLTGKMKVYLDDRESEHIAVVTPGEIVGEMSVIDRKEVSAFVVAEEPCRILVMEESSFWGLIGVSHAAACNLLTILAHRLRDSNSLVSDRTHLFRDFSLFGNVDALTGLQNRHWLDRMFSRIMTRCRLEGKPLAIIMTDIDEFKKINDGWGHFVGDSVIHGIAQVIVDHCRPSQSVTRYGGDEFIIILPDLDLSRAKIVAERLRVAVMEATASFDVSPPFHLLSISLGVAEAGAEDSPETLLATADAALYRAKNGGRNRISE